MKQFYPVIVALVFNAFDIISGLIAGAKNKDIESSKLRDGLFKKVGFIMCYAVAYIVDTYGTMIGFQISIAILPIIVLYVCTTELVSILENICKINPDILPERLMSMFHISKSEDITNESN